MFCKPKEYKKAEKEKEERKVGKVGEAWRWPRPADFEVK